MEIPVMTQHWKLLQINLHNRGTVEYIFFE